MQHGWSIKHVQREIVLSATYRQSSFEDPAAPGTSSDPDNHLLWRQNPRRLDAETLRDSMLAVSGKLLPADGGKPRWPPVPEELLRTQPAILAVLTGEKPPDKLQGWYADPLEQCDVRSVFLIQKRSLPVPFLQPFDLPDGVTPCARRSTTTVAPQALTLLNSDTTVRLARALAERITFEKTSARRDANQLIDRAFELTLLRGPESSELQQCRSTFDRDMDVHRKHLGPLAGETDVKLTALTDVCRALMNVNEFVYVD
jgi:hypothetical protein